jgi:hypothetical protein
MKVQDALWCPWCARWVPDDKEHRCRVPVGKALPSMAADAVKRYPDATWCRLSRYLRSYLEFSSSGCTPR